MKKIPSLFKRDYKGNRQVYNEVTEGSEWVINGEGVATRKYDGTSCMILDGKLYKRYEVNKRRDVPQGFIPAQDADPVTGKQPGWVLVGSGNDDMYHRMAFDQCSTIFFENGTYELVGPKINGNRDNFESYQLVRHGGHVIKNIPTDFDSLSLWLRDQMIEGVVWHHPDGRMAKIKKRDFGYKW